MKEYYLDHAATTCVKPEVLKAMLPFLNNKFANPSSAYKTAQEARKAVENARKQVAEAIGAEIDEIYFTSGGSEADNLAIKGFARANKKKGNHIITSKIEHMAVLESCKALEKEGFVVTYLNVDENGVINLEELKKSITSQTIMISIMFANNEVGTIQPIEEIAEIARKNNIFFHTDAVQAVGNVKINVKKMNIGGLSLSAHKFYGPKGVGALYIGRKYNFESIISGGHQEKNKRAGTENVPGIVGMGCAIEIANENIEINNEKLKRIRDKYIKEIFENISDVRINGDKEKRLPGNANISFKGVGSSSLLLLLSEDKIYASGGSACKTGENMPSHVLKAMGLNDEISNGAIRTTFGEENSEDDVGYIVKKLKENVNKLRQVEET